MARIAGVDLPPAKRAEIGLTYIYGVGRTRSKSLLHRAGLEPQVISQNWLAMVLFCLGFPHQASAQSNAVIAEARRLAHPPLLAGSLALVTRLLLLLGENATLDERADELLAALPPGATLSRRGRSYVYGCCWREHVFQTGRCIRCSGDRNA